MRSYLHRFATLAVALCLAGSLLSACSHVPVASLVKLANFDLLQTDPSNLRVAVRYPVSIRIPEGGARMELTLKEKASGKVLLEESIAFEKVTSKAEKAELSAELKEGRRVEIYKLPADSIPAFRAFQTRLTTMDKKEREKVEGRMEIGVNGCLAFSEKPSGILISTYLKAEEFGGYIPLLRDVDLEEQMAGAGSKGQRELRPCKETPDPNG
jgi:hypothetical protein